MTSASMILVVLSLIGRETWATSLQCLTAAPVHCNACHSTSSPFHARGWRTAITGQMITVAAYGHDPFRDEPLCPSELTSRFRADRVRFKTLDLATSPSADWGCVPARKK